MNNEKISTTKGFTFFVLILSAFLAFLASISFVVGRFTKIELRVIPMILINEIVPVFTKTWTSVDESIVLNLREPRIIASIIVGASLAISGVAYQVMFSNPVASSDSLGVSSSAAFGAVLGFLLELDVFYVKCLAFFIGFVSVFVIYLISSRMSNRRNVTIFLILIGMIISSLFGALLSILKYIADPIDQLPKITYWLMGSMSNVRSSDMTYCLCFFIVGALPLFLLRWRLNLLLLSDAEAKSIGENMNVLRFITIICSTLLTSSAVAMTGGISWIGLVIPHMSRLLVGNDSRKLLPVSALLGSIFLLAMDNIARSITVYELPISILTSIFGAPAFFAILIWRRKQIVDEN